MRSGGLNLNGPYFRDALNIYLIDAKRATSALPDGVGRAVGTLRAALPRQRVILADASYLAQVKVAADLETAAIRRGDRTVTSYNALAVAIVEGPDDALHSRLGADADWRRGTNDMFDGAVAFLIAHEMGHIAAGFDPALDLPFNMPQGLRGLDRDRFWACTNLVGARVAGSRRREAEADQYAMELLGQIPYPSLPALRFELGALFLLNAELGKSIAAMLSLRENGRAIADRAGISLNQKLVDGLAASRERDPGFIRAIFPDTHPSGVDRLLSVANGFARNPNSLSYGNQQNMQFVQTWSLVLQLMCKNIVPQQ
jgi:hypothetical protein